MAYERLNRPPLSSAVLNRALVGPDSWIREVVVTQSTTSTNADLVTAAHAGAREGTVHTTDLQTAGKGRLARSWSAPASASIAVSILVRPRVDTGRWTILPLMAGLAVESALRDVSLNPSLKWPNDVLMGGYKVAGIMSEITPTDTGPAGVIGIGLNTTVSAAELPVPTATSLVLAGADTTDRTVILRRLLRTFEALYTHWDANDADVVASYRTRCATIGQDVRVELPTGEVIHGHADDVDDTGRLVVNGQALASGEITHVRSTS